VRPARWATSRRLLPIAAGLAAFLVLSWQVLDPDAQLFYRDTGRLYYPLKRYIADRLRAGHLPLWDPWTEAGVSLLGQMSPAIFHPWTLLYLVFPFDLAFKLNHLLPLLLAGVGTYLLARRLGASRTGATAGGLIFGSCGYLVSQAASNLIFVVGPAGVPLALERFIALLESPSRGRLLAASALLALCAYGGEPQSMLMCGLIGSAFAVARALSRREKPWRTVALIAAWGGLAVALSAPVALPAAHQFSRSTRGAGLSAYERQRFSVSPRRLPGLFVPRAFDDVPELAETLEESRAIMPFQEYLGNGGFAPGIYLGAGALLLAAFAALAGRRGRFFLLGALILVVASTGEELGLQPILARAVPGFALFRYAEKQMAFASLLVAVAAALGLDAAFAGRRRTSILAAISGAAAAGMAIFAAVLGRGAPSLRQRLVEVGTYHLPATADVFIARLRQGLTQEWQFLALFALAAGAAAIRPRFPGRALAAAACGVAVVLSGSAHLSTLPVEFFHQPPPLARDLLETAGPSGGAWRLYTRPDLDLAPLDLDPKRMYAVRAREPLRPQYNGLFGIESVADYFTLPDANYSALLEGAPRESFDLLTVRFFVSMPGALTEAQAKDAGFKRTHFGMWLLTLPPRPRARLLDQVEVAPTEAALAKRLREVDPSRTALLLPAEAEAAAGVHRSPSAPPLPLIARPAPERIAVEVSAPTPSILEVGEHYDRGWRARVDGKPAPTLAVDGAILGAVVPAGRHSVELRFRPAGFLEGIAVALAALLFLIVTKFVSLLPNSVASRPRSPPKVA
jgi:hypothetical protein